MSKYSEKKIFVLDTSVILFDHLAVTNFQEHDIAIPITVLEELDQFKKGNDTKNFEARQFIRYIDQLSIGQSLNNWVTINESHKSKLRVEMNPLPKSDVDATKAFNNYKADNLILNTALNLRVEYPGRKIVLVTKDINLRIKARSLGLDSEDYQTGKLKDVSGLYKGIENVQLDKFQLIDQIHKGNFVDKKDIEGVTPINNQYFIFKNERNSTLAYFNPNRDCYERVQKKTVSGIKPKNAEQTFAIHSILNEDVKLVSIQGVAGTGKTLVALASAIAQRNNFSQIYLARPIVALSNKDLGYLPGDAEEKVNPYMEPLWDNLKVIQNQFKETSKEYARIKELIIEKKLVVTPLAFIRGRSFSNVIFIVDEAQNLTPLEVKTIISRAGEGTKIIFTGDIHQIDTPYLDTESNGLSYMIDKLKGNPIYTHITLEKGERSELANLANDYL